MGHHFIKSITIISFIYFIPISLIGDGTHPVLQNKLHQLANTPFFKYASLGISVRNMEDGKILAEIQKDKMLIPASTLKLVTTISSIALIGEDFKYKTNITYDGKIDVDGTLKGNIYIEGSGDPTFGSDRMNGCLNSEALFKKIVEDIKTCGITCIEGDIIADESIFNSFPISPSWQWNDLGNYYAAGAWGLNINENEYEIYYHRSGPIGSLGKLAYFSPYIPLLDLSSEVTIDSADTGDNAYIFGGPYHYGKRIVGTIPQGKDLFKIKGSIPDPPLFISYSILKEIQKKDMGGHQYKTQYHTSLSRANRKIISSYTSPSLKDIVAQANTHSINIYCESLLKTIGSIVENDGAGSVGIRNIKNFIKDTGVSFDPLHMEDGSGLSTRNLMSPDFMAEFLYASAKKLGINTLLQIIPKAGESGTVKNMLVKSKAKGHIWMKSGSMDKILSYAGYCKTASGKMVSFSVMLNASTAEKMKFNKAELEKILESIYLFS